jgi:hypothetical protein
MEIVKNEVLDETGRKAISESLNKYYATRHVTNQDDMECVVRMFYKKYQSLVRRQIRFGHFIHCFAEGYSFAIGVEHDEDLNESIFIENCKNIPFLIKKYKVRPLFKIAN